MHDPQSPMLPASEQPDQQMEAPLAPPRRTPLQRLGCAVGLALWVIALIVPCIFITLAARGEITVDTGELPGQRLRLWLIMEARQRGVGIEWPSVHTVDDQTCLQIEASFLLWEGRDEEPISYCRCFERADDSWLEVSSYPGLCSGD